MNTATTSASSPIAIERRRVQTRGAAAIGARGGVPSFGAAIIEKFFLLPNWENVNISYIIGRPAMMGKADRLPP